MAARLVAIEGLDGSGKETQTRLLVDALRARERLDLGNLVTQVTVTQVTPDV